MGFHDGRVFSFMLLCVTYSFNSWTLSRLVQNSPCRPSAPPATSLLLVDQAAAGGVRCCAFALATGANIIRLQSGATRLLSGTVSVVSSRLLIPTCRFPKLFYQSQSVAFQYPLHFLFPDSVSLSAFQRQQEKLISICMMNSCTSPFPIIYRATPTAVGK